MEHDAFEPPNRPRPTLLWLTRYLVKDQPPADREVTRQWLAQEPGRSEAVERVERALQYADDVADRSFTIPESDIQTALASAMQRIGPETQKEKQKTVTPLRGLRASVFRTARSAGLWVGAVVCVALFTWFIGTQRNEMPGFARTYVTASGERADLRLPDGSRMALAPASQMKLEWIQSSKRTITLTGKAVFSVNHHDGAPFAVLTASGETQVLGTEFMVSQYSSDDHALVVVTSGKVRSQARHAIRRNSAQVTLTQGMVGIVSDSGARGTTVTNPASYLNWTRGQLEFEDAPIVDVLTTMGRWYGVRFQLADSTLSKAIISANFDFKSTQAALQYLKAVIGAKMDIQVINDTTVVTLRSRTSEARSPQLRRNPAVFGLSREVGR